MITKLKPEELGFMYNPSGEVFELETSNFHFSLDYGFQSMHCWFLWMWEKPILQDAYSLCGTFGDCTTDKFSDSTQGLKNQEAIEELLLHITPFIRKKIVDDLLLEL